ncbi:5-methylcytosine-specific restriction endonuclease system specificity protein McrC [Priestia megaterium]|uniref:5-methylcytosine-specific restriction endonuclease system specificity protein McrC n=1 Tax=Priestia megaterium TaxID=1404 RepID=A0A6H1P2G8_PRIMG|nr:5-methylcytosine-specific restriction endonuclease system specificity protein McrC [Priestia megaterium]QIZ07617.1 5-methylcytosine-specific restriction endonuclease system specificity protein McrC [Priestia megaterium]
MVDQPKIPIKNIYYMLCYAWNLLDQSDSILVGSDKFDNIYNLFARIYINGTSSLIKRGLNRYYIEENEALSTLKGKIKIGDSLRKQTIQQGRMICQYNEFSSNIRLNQIVKSTIHLLIKSPKVDEAFKKRLLKLRLHFSDIHEIPLSESLFAANRYNRNNKHYQLLINVSELIYKGLISNEAGNEMEFADFIRDHQMSKLYEKFVLNFYRAHLDKENYLVHSPKIKWDLSEEVDGEDLYLLPEMRTDIAVENKIEKTQLIIDTKYYRQTLISDNRSAIEKVRTTHLFQIYAYINNSDFPGSTKGMLLYPTIDKEINAKFPIGGKMIFIRTLNLNAEWNDISDRLLSLIR